MTNDQIDKFILKNSPDQTTVNISFKNRHSITGIFIKTADYDELRSKNFWRIVSGTNIPAYKKSQDANLARIFNGVDITRITL